MERTAPNMDKLCDVIKTQTPALTCHYRLQTAIVKSAREKTPMIVMDKEGNVTLPLLIAAGVLIAVAIPCVCRHCCKKRAKKQAE